MQYTSGRINIPDSHFVEIKKFKMYEKYGNSGRLQKQLQNGGCFLFDDRQYL